MDDSLTAVVGVLEHVLDGALVIDPDGRVSYANLDTQRIFARDRGLLLGLHVEQLLVPLPADWPEPGVHTAQARRADGSVLPVRLYATSVGDCTIVTLQDRASDTPVAQMPDPVDDPSQMLWSIAAAVDAFLFAGELSEDGWYLPVFHGPGIEKLLGAGVAYEDANRAYDTCVHPEDYPAYEALYELTTREVGVPAELTYRLRGAGRPHALGARAFGAAARRQPHGPARRRLRRHPSARRARLEQAADRSVAVERFERVVELANDLILACDRDGTLHFANPAAESVLGFPVTELVGSGWDLFCHPEDLGDALNAVRAAFGQPASGPGTVRCRTRAAARCTSPGRALRRRKTSCSRRPRRHRRVAARRIERRSRTDAHGLFNRRPSWTRCTPARRARRGVSAGRADGRPRPVQVHERRLAMQPGTQCCAPYAPARHGGAPLRHRGALGRREFCVVVGDLGRAGAAAVAETVRAAIAGARPDPRRPAAA
jgi:PAS domain-containing protein